ncbi:calsequestrin-1-like [Morus notabilis]|uniref:calsequestrin-1-like n=1 Tax=Morus notabilis TaxID=981085 RepID=UPI000CED1A92|nr:calsequestrin-1-like [Morus notabilis]
MEVNKTDGDKVEIEDQKEDADYDDEEDDNDDDDDDDEEEEDDDGDEDDDEEDDGEDDNDGDEGDKENKRKFFLQDLKLFDCSNCHKRLFNTVYMVCIFILIPFFFVTRF